MSTSELSLYTFRLDGPDPEAIDFSCLATSEGEAEGRARAAGHRSFSLVSVVPVDPGMNTSLDRRIAGNPLLGPDWSPLVDVLEIVMKKVFLAPHWTLHIYGEAYGFDPVVTPGAQCVLEADGSLTVEVTGPSPRHLTHFAEALEFVGWGPPVDEFGVLHDNKNANRTFLPGWTERVVAVALLEVLTSVYSIGREDFFHFGEKVADDVERLGLLERAGKGPQFRLITVAKTPEAVEDEDVAGALMPVSQDLSNADEVSGLDGTPTRGIRLKNRDLSMGDFSGADFTGAEFVNVSFRGRSLSGAIFTACSFSGVDFSNAVLSNALFDECVVLHGVNFSDADLDGASFAKAVLSRSWFMRANLHSANFSGADLKFADFWGAELDYANFTGANLSSAVFASAGGTEVNFDLTILTSCNFKGAKFPEADFTTATLGGTDFSFANLNSSVFYNMVLTGNDFSGASFEQAELGGTDFRRALGTDEGSLNFYRADLSRSKFDGENVQDANFIDADLGDASFVDCSAQGADFTGAELGESDFTGADLTGCLFEGDELAYVLGARSMSAERKAINEIAETDDDDERYRLLTEHWLLLHSSETYDAAQRSALTALGVNFGEASMQNLGFAVSHLATGDASKYARKAAALGLSARHLVSRSGFTQEHYDLLVLLWATHFDLAHPADTRPRLAIWGDKAEFGPETDEIRRVLRLCAHMSVQHFEQLVSIEREEDDGDVLVAELSAFRALRRSNRELQWFDLQQLIDDLPGSWGAGPASDDDNWRTALRCIRLVVHGLLVRDCISDGRFEAMAKIWRQFDWKFLQKDDFGIE